MRKPFSRNNQGFTLIEMMVTISVMIILLGMIIPMFSASIRQAKEDNFRTNLATLNKAIYQYTLDKQKAPKSLDDLVTAKYIKRIPEDISGSQDWQVEEDDKTVMNLQQQEGGVYAVHSSSNKIGSNGKPYSEW